MFSGRRKSLPVIAASCLLLQTPALDAAEDRGEASDLTSKAAFILERAGFELNAASRAAAALPAGQQRSDEAAAAAASTNASARMPGPLQASDTADAANARIPGIMVVFADAATRENADRNLPPPDSVVSALTLLGKGNLVYRRAMSFGAHVFGFVDWPTRAEFALLADELMASGLVEAVYPDTLAEQAAVTPHPLQWNLLEPGSFFIPLNEAVVGINATGAWDMDFDFQPVTVAVVDTGISDPAPVPASRLLPGYDFISNSTQALDNSGRDTNARDAGDYYAAGQCPQNPNGSASSTWHGTVVAGVIAAAHENQISNYAGINPYARIVPVRVAGRCGALESDVIDGMLWAGGISVPGVPDNANPARIINLSISSPAPSGCTGLYEEAVLQLLNRSVIIVGSAGNQDADAADYLPAACVNVLTVGAIDHTGERAAYSNWGQEADGLDPAVELSAPGGEPGQSALPGSVIRSYAPTAIPSLNENGLTFPTGALTMNHMTGTSIAAAHVTGAMSLAMSADPEQLTDLVLFSLAVSTTDFDAGSRCAEEFPLCGTGIVNAEGVLEIIDELDDFRPVLEFYHEGLNHYFMSGGRDEITLVRQGTFGDWQQTGGAFYVWRDASIEGVFPVCRFYGTPGIGPNSHFYTVDPSECELVKQDAGWSYEGTAFYAMRPAAGNCFNATYPLYRYYNQRAAQNDSNHRYSTNLADRTAMEAAGWAYEGVAMCVVN